MELLGICGYAPFKILRAKTGKEFASKGNFKAAIWYKMTPNAQISAFVEYGFPSTIYGDR
jgi:hypothetical protein